LRYFLKQLPHDVFFLDRFLSHLGYVCFLLFQEWSQLPLVRAFRRVHLQPDPFFTPLFCILLHLPSQTLFRSRAITLGITLREHPIPYYTSIHIIRGSSFSHRQATLVAIRDLHEDLYPGIRESQARTMMTVALGAAGLKDGGCLALFGVRVCVRLFI